MAEPALPPAANAEMLLLLQEIAAATQRVILGEVARLIAHEISQPLAAIAANGGACLNWLDREPPELDEARIATRRLVAEAQRAAQEMRGILAFLERKPLPRVRQSVEPLVRTAAALAEPRATALGILLAIEAPGTLPDVEVNRAQMLHVLISLLVNACESLQSVPPPRAVRIAIETREGQVEVSVEDNGPGLGETNIDRPFEAFFTTKEHGLGLGLAVGRRIVESHGGRLWIDARPAGGHVFRFTVPVATP